MTTNDDDALSGTIFEDTDPVSIRDLSRICAVEERHIVEFVEEGVLHVIEIGAPVWHFNTTALRRARIAVRLERDLELNLPGVALALDLMEQLEQLRSELAARNR
jgi:chaperone modulatory protein CbpM